MPGFSEVAERVWVARYAWYDVNVTLVEGERGLVVVDTHASSVAAAEVVEDLREVSPRPVVAVVNTHEHVDHVLGNALLRQEYAGVPIHAHEVAAARTREAVERVQRSAVERGDERAAEIAATPVLPADHTFSSATVIDLGDRVLELVHPGRGHTAGDLLVRVPDADVVLVGDLVEESGPPAYGADSWPLEWPATLDFVLQLVGPDTVVVPGHGRPVGRAFVSDQRVDVGLVAETIRDHAARGIGVDDALWSAEWPFDREHLAEAVRRGYDQLPPSGRRLPLL